MLVWGKHLFIVCFYFNCSIWGFYWYSNYLWILSFTYIISNRINWRKNSWRMIRNRSWRSWRCIRDPVTISGSIRRPCLRNVSTSRRALSDCYTVSPRNFWIGRVLSWYIGVRLARQISRIGLETLRRLCIIIKVG